MPEPDDDLLRYSPNMETINFMGREITPQSRPGRSPTPMGFFGGMGLGFGTSTLDVRQRWASLLDEPEDAPMTTEDIQEIVGGRSIETYPGMSRAELERRVEWADRMAYEDQYAAGFFGPLFGGLPPYILEPVTLATAFVGSGNIIRAQAARSLGGFLREGAKGGAKIGVASSPGEVGIQISARGEVDAASAILSTLAPLPLTPIMAAPGYALRGLRNPRGTAEASNSHMMPEGADPRHAASQEGDITPPPPVFQRFTDPVRPPRARLVREFEEYEGGVNTWLRDYAAGAERARRYAGERGIDPEAPALRALVLDEAMLTAVASRRTGQDLRALAAAARTVESGAVSQTDRARLRFANMLDEQDNLLPEFVGLNRDPERMGQFMQRGPESFWQQRVRQSQQQLEQAIVALREAGEARRALPANARTEAKAAARERVTAAERGVAEAERVHSVAVGNARVVDPQRIDPERVMAAVDAARLENTPRQFPLRDPDAQTRAALAAQRTDGPPTARAADDDPVTGDLETWARSVARDADLRQSIQAKTQNVMERFRACGVAA